jgi:hypothetical protein
MDKTSDTFDKLKCPSHHEPTDNLNEAMTSAIKYSDIINRPVWVLKTDNGRYHVTAYIHLWPDHEVVHIVER